MTTCELKEWAERIICADPDGNGFIRTDVAPTVLRLFQGTWRVEFYEAQLTAAYRDLCAVLGWAEDGRAATVEMVARAAAAIVKREQVALPHRVD